MRFDPDNIGSVGNRKKGPQAKTKKIIYLPIKEPVELRKADEQWVKPAEQEADLAKTDKETQVTFAGSHDPVTMVICRNCSGNLLAY